MSYNTKLSNFQRYAAKRNSALTNLDKTIKNRNTRLALLKHYERDMLINYSFKIWKGLI